MNFNNKADELITFVYLECGITAFSNFNTGIQRVVRSICHESKEVGLKLGVSVMPVAFSANKFYPVQESLKQPRENNTHQVLSELGWLQFLRPLVRVISRLCPFRICQLFLRQARSLILHFTKQNKKAEINLVPINSAGKPSILVLLDSNWDNQIWHSVDSFRVNGGKVCAVLYDLIPFTHPETVAEQTRLAHTTWWREAPRHLDAVICISESVQNDFLKWQVLEQIDPSVPSNRVGYFYLGAELSNIDPVIRLITEKEGYFMMVGSLEPRKNHKIVLDAFELLWNKEVNVRLAIVGAYGWKSDELLARIESHPQLNKQLFLIRDASDRDLTSLYGKTLGLIIASLAEGYGLPIVEAYQRGASVICSDIPVFREVAGSGARYFNVTDPQSLVRQITDCLAEKINVSEKIENKYGHCLSWRESTDQLLRLACQLVKSSNRVFFP